MVNLRDTALLVAAVGIGVLMFDALAVPIALLGLSLVQWTGASAGTPAMAVGSVPGALAALALGALLVLVTTPFARDPRKLALLLAISFPLVIVIVFAAYMSDMLPISEAVAFSIRTFAVQVLAFSVGCVVTSVFLPRQLPGAR
jgi:hypothetical protein